MKQRKNDPLKTNKKRIETIFSKLSKEDLQKFLTDQFSKERNLSNTFIANFAELLDENPESKYRTIVDNLYSASKNRNGWVDYRNARNLGKSLIELSQKAYSCLENNKIAESITICKVIIENVSQFLGSFNDSSGYLSDAIYNSFSTLRDAIAQSPAMLKDQLFDYCIQEYQNQKYRDIGIDDEFLTLLPDLVSIEEQEQIFLDVLDKRLSLEIAASNENYYYTFGCVRIISAKVDYFRRKEMNEEADKLIRDNLNYPEFREILIDELIAKKDFSGAKKLCLEGIKISESKSHSGRTHDWMQKLLHISQLEKNVNDIRKWSEILFFKFGYEMTYYKTLKLTYSGKDKEWKNECERILGKLGNEAEGRKNKNQYQKANVFIEENYLDRLLDLIQHNTDDVRFIDKFAEKIMDQYPKELAAAYSTAIKEHATTTDRRVYEEVIMYLKNLGNIRGGENEVMQLLTFFRQTYRKRKAMMELLNENFPGDSVL